MQSRDLTIRTVRYATITLSIAIGLGLVSIAAAFGDCSAFGGRCPADAPPLLDDDTFGIAASGTFLATAVPVFAWRPSWRRLGIAVSVGLIAALVIGLAIRAGANG